MLLKKFNCKIVIIVNIIYRCDIPRTPHRRQAPDLPGTMSTMNTMNTNSVSRTSSRQSNTLNSSVIGIGK